MKSLRYLLHDIEPIEIIGNTDIGIENVSFNSNDIKKNELFIAVRGTHVDAHKFIPDAIKKGAVAVICETFPVLTEKNITYIKVHNSGNALGLVCSNFFDNPSTKLKLIGITGTNGKTTIATLLCNLFIEMGYKAGLISTICNRINREVIPSTHTTPDQIVLNKLLARMVENGCEYCFMEVSSHAIVQNRVAGLDFAGGVFTNITHDHLDYHKTFENYISAKKSFFDRLSESSFALTNIDDRNGSVMLQNTKARKYSYSLKTLSDFKTKILENSFGGMQLQINSKEIWCKLVGYFNAYNLTAIYATAILLDQKEEAILTILSNLESAEGRFESFKDSKNVVAIVDYAHTPDALKNVLDTIASIKKNSEKIITVIGAGGDRDKSKRPEMASISSEISDRVILTSDNPRSEDPVVIVEEMEKGISPSIKFKVLTILDRKEAIKTAYALAQSGDIIFIAGKGHEKYQEIKGVKYPFDDRQIIKELMLI
jgi:UDP-N-acetylmuramoyl-L-alanyl-D-glutamate--2,6-diaminopimelate ligase